jgi:hypothetical protein
MSLGFERYGLWLLKNSRFEGVLSAIAWLRKLSRPVSPPGFSLWDYFRLARLPGFTTQLSWPVLVIKSEMSVCLVNTRE